MDDKLSRRNTIIILLIGLAGNLAWAIENQFYNVFMYEEIAPKPIYISIMVGASAITAAITAIIMGAISDIKAKRRIYMLYGFALWAITTAIYPVAAWIQIPLIAVTVAIIFDCIMTYFGSTAFDAAFNAYITDITTVKNRGKGMGVLQLTMLFSTLIVYGMAGIIVESIGFYNFFYIMGAVVGALGVLGAYLSEDPADLKPSGLSLQNQIKNTYKMDVIRKNKDIFLILIGMLIWATAFNVFFPFILIFLEYYWGLDFMTAAIVVFIGFIINLILAYPIGSVIDKIGRKRITILCVICNAISLIFFIISANLILLIIGGVLTQFFMTGWNIAANAWMRDLFPKKARGQFSGYYVLFAATLPMIIGSAIGGILSETFGNPIVIDGIPGFVPNWVIFVVAAFIMLPAVIPLFYAKEKPPKLGQEQIDEEIIDAKY
ncbi:MAG: MFS transporter [Candidatus Lokiarchaeota archaeon]|nr:MFS transporter [Candidatus Lokiarchaeota archaeon]MBD3200260.1 MFS transporter [Candidatus Lokiarchaeota archaeon]